jgi:hypothetical protein
MEIWQELSDYHQGHRGRFLSGDSNKGYKRNTKQINNKSRMAVRTLASGMMSGITSPARPWFQLGAGDPDMNEYAPVKEWLHAVQSTMYRVFSQSNTYNSLHSLYTEVGVFGTGAMGVFNDFNNVIRCKTFTTGEYMLGANGQDEIDTLYREYQYSVGQVVKMFGYDNCSDSVKNLWDTGATEAWIDIVHCIEPNDNRDHMSPFANKKPYRSVYYEASLANSNRNQFLLESGFDTFPIMAPRWDITGGDIYATDCPGMDALGDTKALQLGEKRRYQAVDKVANPLLQAPSSMHSKLQRHGLKGGDIIYTDNASDSVSSVYGNYRPDINAIGQINMEASDRISHAFYEDLFLMLASSDRRQITAREVAEKQEEKLLMLGPVLERLHSELLDPLIDRTFDILQSTGVLPPPPKELQGSDLNVEYISVLAQAQRMVAVTGLERTVGFASQLASIWPEARHKIDPMQAIDEYANAMGTNPRVVRSDDKTNEMVQGEQQAQAQQAAMMQGQELANTAKTVSETEVTDDNALGTLMRNAGLA